MKIAVIAGVHGSGKTALIGNVLRHLQEDGSRAGVYKVDSLDGTQDQQAYERQGFPAVGHAAGSICPDHESMVELGPAWDWACRLELDVLLIETGGLCHRCSPFLKRAFAVCVFSGLSNVGTPEKMRPMVEQADWVVLTRAEMISHAERQVFLGHLAGINPKASVSMANGLTGEGSGPIARAVASGRDIRLLDIEPLRSTLPMGYCHYCQGIGSGHE